MKKFLIKSVLFILPLVIIGIALILSPPTKIRQTNFMAYGVQKDSLLRNTLQPRLILIGGSNVIFGINSGLIKDSLRVNPVDMGLHAGVGLQYMLDSTRDFIKSGDIVVISPEYDQFYGTLAYGSEPLTRMILDVSLSNIKYLKRNQVKPFLKFVRPFLQSKLDIKEYKSGYPDINYSVHSFNEYGDMTAHWYRETKETIVDNFFSGELNNDIFRKLKSYITDMNKRGAHVYMSYPPLREKSFEKNKIKIHEVEEAVDEYDLPVLGEPEDFIIAEDKVYDTQYHFLKEGVDERTMTLINKIKDVLGFSF